VRSCRRRSLAAYPLSVAMTGGRFRGRPRVPVRRRTASNSGMTWVHSLPWAGVMLCARGMPAASVRRWMRPHWPLPPRATPAPPPVPGGTGAVDGPIWPLNHPVSFSHPEHPGWPQGERAIGLPALSPALRGTFGHPLSPTRQIAPTTARHQHVQQSIHHVAERGMRHASPACGRFRGKTSAKRCHSKSLKPSRRPAIRPSRIGGGYYGILSQISGTDSWMSRVE
jgi:hypothetical protein